MRSISLGPALVGIFVVGCSGGSTSTQGTGGSIAVGGAQNSGGATGAGGAGTTGGTTAVGASSGGASVATGGAGEGGTTPATGGKSSAGGSAAGGQATGGKSAAGGAATGGQAAGGKSSVGGSNTGGQATGGKSSAGGSDTGGQANGGKSSAGGANTGGQATGGKSSAGGANTGGQATAGSSAGGQATGGGTSGGETGKSSGCGKTSTITQYNKGTPINITVAGTQRRYVLNIPTNYDNTKPYKLVVTLHARDGNDMQMFDWQYYGLLPESKDTAIFVAPNGQLNGKPCAGTSKQGESSCGWPNPSGQDLALVDAVVAQTLENFCVDTNRIFATGWSYGASMSYEVACQRPLGGASTANWGVRAMAIYAGAQMSGSCKPSAPVAYYASHGTHDSVLCYESSSTGCQVNTDGAGIGMAQNFAKANGCTWATPTKVTSGAHVCTNMTGCTKGYALEFCSFNGDHTPYPDNGQSAGSWGPPEAWKFLNQF